MQVENVLKKFKWFDTTYAVGKLHTIRGASAMDGHYKPCPAIVDIFEPSFPPSGGTRWTSVCLSKIGWARNGGRMTQAMIANLAGVNFGGSFCPGVLGQKKKHQELSPAFNRGSLDSWAGTSQGAAH